MYPFGLDYTWMQSAEEIVYLNNFKMKTAVMYGVAQMLMGTCFRISNQLYQKKYIDVVVEGITQVVMLTALFGFMDAMIIGKWLIDWDVRLKEKNEQPPGVIMAMIVMFLNGGVYDKVEKGPQWGELVPNQTVLMQSCVIIAVLCVPIMLLVKPFYYSRASHVDDEDDAHKKESTSALQLEGLNVPFPSPEDHSFGQLFIHQMIETIEYSLGTVSNTASYLRLWALSLAHGQLAKVFFDQTLGASLNSGGYISVSTIFKPPLILLLSIVVHSVLRLLRLHVLRPDVHGPPGGLPSHAPSPLGRILEQVLQGSWYSLQTLCLQQDFLGQ